MTAQLVSLLAFNRGKVSPRGIARVDVERVPLSAQVMTNWMPRVLGSMMLRPGLGYLGSTQSNSAARFIPFVFSTTDTALVELTNNAMRLWIGDALLTRVAVTAAVTNGAFTTDLSGWTDSDEGGATSAWVTGSYMGLTGDGTDNAIRDQQVTVNQTGTEHALSVIINRGPVVFSVGSSLGTGEYFNQITLESGSHSLAFTPTGNFWIRFQSRLKRLVLVQSVQVESAGVVSISTQWATSALGNITFDQSGDEIFCACYGQQQQVIQRWNTRSWGVVRYAPEDGPFFLENVTPTTLAPGALSGNTTLTASRPIFVSKHVGSLFSFSSTGQTVAATISAENTFTNAIKVTDVGSKRAFTINLGGLSGTGSTVTLQQSTTSDTGPWVDIQNFTNSGTTSHNDGLDNYEVWYRIGVKTGNYAAGTITASLIYNIGTIRGICRATSFSSTTVLNVEVLTDFGGTTAASTWEEGQWSDYRGYPSAVAFDDGRLWWAGKGGIWGSVSDAYSSFDETFVGDAGPLNDTIGQGPVDTINWLLSVDRLLIGTPGAELCGLSDAIDSPITPSNFHIKTQSTQGSAAIQAVRIDSSAIFVQRGGTRIFQMVFNPNSTSYGRYDAVDLTTYIPEIGMPGVLRMAVQRQPDTRVHCVRTDGTVAMLILDSVENVTCWCDVTTSGSVEDVVVLPGLNGVNEDQVYYVINRTINGQTVRYLEKWSLETECVGGTLNKQADAFVTFAAPSGTPTAMVTELTHLIGQSVICWADGVDQGGPFKVSNGGTITLPNAISSAMVGLPYSGQWQSSKLSHVPFHVSTFTGRGTALTQKKMVEHIGVIMYQTHTQGLQYGPDFDHLDSLPLIEDGAVVSETIYDMYDEESFEFAGEWDSDARICLQANAPRPCTLCALVMPISIEDKP